MSREHLEFLRHLQSGGVAVSNEPHSGHVTDRHSSTGGRLEKNRKKTAMNRSRADHEQLVQEKYPSHYMPNVPRQVRNKGGEVNPHVLFLQHLNSYAPGGAVDDQPPSLDHDNPPPERDLNAFGLYSKAAEVANAATGQNETMTGKQWKNYLSARGVKPDEFKWSWYDQAFDDDQKYHKSEIASHFNYQNTEPYKEALYTDEGNKYKLNEEGYGEIAKDIARYPAFAQEFLGINNSEQFYRDTDGKSLQDKIDYLIEEYEPLLRSAIEERQPNKATKYAEHQMEGGAKNYRELVLQHDPDNDKFSYSGHFGESNPLLHIRMADRLGPNGEKLLHIEEMQSDWGQQGRRAGFNEEDKKLLEKKWKDLDRQLSEHDFILRNKARKMYENSNDQELKDSVENMNLIQLARNYGTEEEKNKTTALIENYRKALNDFKSPIVEEGPHVGDTNKWVDLGLKRILKEAADGGYDGITFAPGDVQVGRWANKGLKKPYDETIPSRMQKLLTKVDPQLKFGSYSMEMPLSKDDQGRVVSFTKVHHVPLNAAHHAEIQKGFERMKRGGSVDVQLNDKERASSETVNAPLRWQSAPDHPQTQLAYITDAEADLLKHLDMHNSGIDKEDHHGPEGVPSYDGTSQRDAPSSGGGNNPGDIAGGGISSGGGGNQGSPIGGGSGGGGGGGNGGISSSGGGGGGNGGGGGGGTSIGGGTGIPGFGSGIGAGAPANPAGIGQSSQDLGNESASPTGPFGFGTTDVGKALVANVLGGGNAQATQPAGISNMAGSPTSPGYTDIGVTAMRASGDTAANLGKLQSLDPSYATKAATLVNRAMDVGMNPTITSAARTLEQQLAINQNPNQIYPSAAPGSSMHNYGLAIDLGGLTPAQQAQLGQMAKEEGIEWGGASDPVHYGLAKEGMSAPERAASIAANLYTGTTDLAKEILGVKPAAAAEMNYPERTRGIVAPATGEINVPNAGDLYGATNAPLAVAEKSMTPMSDALARSEEGAAVRQGDVPGMSAEALQWNKDYTAAMNKMYGNPNEKGLNELSNALIKAANEAPETAADLEKLGAAINLPFGIGSYIASQYGVQPATEKQMQDIADVVNTANMPSDVPADFATPEQMLRDYGYPTGTTPDRAGSMGSVSPESFAGAPMPPERPSEFTSMASSTGRQNYESSSPQESVRSSFDAAFAAARKSGQSTFQWRNPLTGQVGLYTTELKAAGGAAKSSVSKNAKLLHTSPHVEIALSRVSSLPLDAVQMIKNGTRGRS